MTRLSTVEDLREPHDSGAGDAAAPRGLPARVRRTVDPRRRRQILAKIDALIAARHGG